MHAESGMQQGRCQWEMGAERDEFCHKMNSLCLTRNTSCFKGFACAELCRHLLSQSAALTEGLKHAEWKRRRGEEGEEQEEEDF